MKRIPPSPAKSKLNWRTLLRRTHLLMGGILCIPFAILGITGSILVFDDVVQAVVEPPPHALTTGTIQPLAQIIAAAQKAVPAGATAVFVSPPAAVGDLAQIRFSNGQNAGPGGTLVFVDPVSLAVLETRAPGTGFMRSLHQLHANFFLSSRSFVGWLGVAMLCLGVSGLILWWPKPSHWRAAFTIRRGARGYRLLRDLHGMVGIWGLAVFMVVSISGVYLAFPQTVGATVASVLPMRDLRPFASTVKVTPKPGETALDVDGVLALAQQAVPESRVRFVGLPARRDQPYRVTLQRLADSTGAPAVTAFVDPWEKRVAELRDPRSFSAGEWLIAWMHPLHEGSGLGWPYRILVFLSGFLPPLFAGTGVAMWLMKRHARRRNRSAVAGLPQAGE